MLIAVPATHIQFVPEFLISYMLTDRNKKRGFLPIRRTLGCGKIRKLAHLRDRTLPGNWNHPLLGIAERLQLREKQATALKEREQLLQFHVAPEH